MAGTGRGWIAGFGIVTVLVSPRVAIAEASESATISVLLLNQAEVAPVTLERAKTEATRIYRGLGITLAWTDADAAVDYHFTVKVVTKAIAGKGIDGRAMGVAAREPGNGAEQLSAVLFVNLRPVSPASGRLFVADAESALESPGSQRAWEKGAGLVAVPELVKGQPKGRPHLQNYLHLPKPRFWKCS